MEGHQGEAKKYLEKQEVFLEKVSKWLACLRSST